MICSQTMAAMMANDPAKKATITICPPAEQEEFFQEQQFDEVIGGGTDPIAYWRGSLLIRRTPLPPIYGRKTKKDRLNKAEKALEGHENKEKILKILRSE